MRRRVLPNISLAAKCRLLFGVAVLSILAAALYLPWIQMEVLADTAEVRGAEKIALAARLTSHVDSQDWASAQAQLLRDWPDLASLLNISQSAPRLVSADSEPMLRVRAASGFLITAINKFRNRPNLEFVHQFKPDGDMMFVRLALAVRADETDAQPGRLRGLIDVHMPVSNENRHWSAIVLVLACLSGVFLAILVFYLVTQRLILSPVRKLRAVAEQVTAGDTGVRAEIATRDEFEDLADAFNDMLARINESHEALRKINRSLDVKLGELGQKNVALFEANRLKSEFIANVSHELRTPLGLIINFAELLRDALEDPPKDRTRLTRYAGNILMNGRSLLDLINDLLDLAKIEAGKIELHISSFSAGDTCNALIDFVRPLADKKNIELPTPVIEEMPALRSDSGKLKQILYNLLSNAIKFTPHDGRVTLEAGNADNAHIWLKVSDTGPGIAEEMFSAIFEKFRQMDASLTREHGGTGLGLAITKELVGMLGGSITVESEVGKGSAFTVTLPIEAPENVHRPLVSLND